MTGGISLNDALTHTVAFLGGGGFSYLWMSRKDRHDVRQGNFENTERLVQSIESAYLSYTGALAAYDPANPTIESFTAISTGGERYFGSLNMVSSAMLSGLIDENARDRMIVKRICEAAGRSIPSHYKTLSDIAKKRGFPFPEGPDRENYQAIYDAADRFGTR